jgi:hypothetical protein
MHFLWMHGCVVGILKRRRLRRAASATSASAKGIGAAPVASVSQAARLRGLHTYLLSRPLVASALDSSVRARRLLGSGTLLRRSRQHVLRLLHEALRDAEAQGGMPVPPHAPAQVHSLHAQSQAQVQGQQPPRWRSIRRRVVGRIRRSLPEYDGLVVVPPVTIAELDDVVPAIVAPTQ